MSECAEVAVATSASVCDGVSTDSPAPHAAEESSSSLRVHAARPLLAEQRTPPSPHSHSTHTAAVEHTHTAPHKQTAGAVLVRVQPYTQSSPADTRRAADDSSDSDDDDDSGAADFEPATNSLRDTLTALGRFVTFQSTLEPHAPAKVAWDWFIILLALYSFFFTCWIIAFDEDLGGHLAGFDGFVTACFLLDVIVTFRTAFVDFSGNSVFDPRLIADRYLRSMLAVDLIAAMPFHLISPAVSFGHAASPQFVDNCLKANFILRASKLVTSQRIDAFISPAARILKLIFAFFCLAHLFASLFFFVGVIQTTDRTWISAAGLEHKSHTDQYVASMYWALATMVTVGYGDIVPQTVYEQATVIPILMLSALIYATIFGSMAYSMETITSTMRRYQARIDSVKEFAAVYELSPELRRKLEDYSNATWAQTKGFETSVMLGHLPTSVKAEILLYVNRTLIERVPLFKQCSDRFTEALILRMSSQVCLQGDYLFKESDKSSDMFFIRSGSVSIIMDLQGAPTHIAEIAEHSLEPFIGEISLLLGEPRTASVRASTKCVLSKLSQADFFEVMQAFPEEENSLRETATQRLEQDIEREAQALKAKEAKMARGAITSRGSIMAQHAHIATDACAAHANVSTQPAHPFVLSDPSLAVADPVVASAMASRNLVNASLLSRNDKLTKMHSTAVRNSVFGSLGQTANNGAGAGAGSNGGGGGNADSDSITLAQANNRKRMSVTTGLLRSASFTTTSLSSAAHQPAAPHASAASPGPFTHIAEETEDEATHAPLSPPHTPASAVAAAPIAPAPNVPAGLAGLVSAPVVSPPSPVSPPAARHQRAPTIGDRYAITLNANGAASSAPRKHTATPSSLLLPPGSHAPTSSASGMDALLELRRTAVHARQRTGMASLGAMQTTTTPQPPTPMHAANAAPAAAPASPSAREAMLESKLAALTAQLADLSHTVSALQQARR